ncbi:hypothetical protein D3C72_1934590 [compost metagenome]
MSASRKLKSKGESTWAGASSSRRSRALIRLCAWRALVACALKRAMYFSICARWACCFS